MYKSLLSFLFVSFCLITFAQKKNEKVEYRIHRATSPLKIDGIVDEKAWADAQLATDFYQVLPMDTSFAKVRTDVKMTYDDKNLYVVFINYDKLPGPYMVESLKRDFNFGKNDNDLLFIDTFDDQTNGFSFGSNAMGAQWDGLMFNGSSISLTWENKWVSEVKYDDDKWVWECAIPFKTLRYKKGITRWGVNFSRLDLKTTEKSSWAPVPRQFPTASLAYAASLIWDEAPPTATSNISIIPFVLGGINRDQEKGTPTAFRKDFGFDAKVGLTSSMNMDLTVNPDFSQVEVDQQQTNLDRFELLFPEKRQFFLENGDLFSNFGYQTIRPFFSRRIGLNAPIRFGARVSGKLNKDWRIGLMDMQTGKSDAASNAQNFGVIALQRRVFARSNIAVMFVNKQTLDYQSVVYTKNISEFNRNLGIEYNLLSKNNAWTGKMMYLKAFTPNSKMNDGALAGNLLYTNKRWTTGVQIEQVGTNFNAEVGYVPRLNYGKFNPQVGYLFFPKSKHILSHGPSAMLTHYFTKDFSMETENEKFIAYKINFRKTNTLMAWVAHNYVYLLNQFDPTNYAKAYLAKGTEHRWNSFGVDYTSKPQALLTYLVSSRFGGYYANGTRIRLNGEVGYRFQPYVAITMAANYNQLNFKTDAVLPKELVNKEYNFWLVGPRIDVTFTNKLYFTNFLQFNNQNKNVNLNTRLQWRYSPASDLFLVYTDNYYSDTFLVKNRALVLKFTYWWNV
ncbi:hypothetical protein EMA8858_03157 [Emticicia aquatica]|uniref:Hydrolase n=1 Tax=Emticicia aquatica TaxID=1681835 RepID=A0ABN8EXY1_9BACT|nr:DUF5916 domain-containing protein [Emticicia aquatica]CAH0997020.1 hypothetical protein EMA8858_03157 [Emticicia aquatica]